MASKTIQFKGRSLEVRTMGWVKFMECATVFREGLKPDELAGAEAAAGGDLEKVPDSVADTMAQRLAFVAAMGCGISADELNDPETSAEDVVALLEAFLETNQFFRLMDRLGKALSLLAKGAERN